MIKKIAGTRKSCYLRPKQNWLLEVRMVDHYLKFNVWIMCLIPSYHRALSENCTIILKPWFCYVGVYEEGEELVTQGFSPKTKSLPFLRASKITPQNLLSSLLSENKPWELQFETLPPVSV